MGKDSNIGLKFGDMPFTMHMPLTPAGTFMFGLAKVYHVLFTSDMVTFFVYGGMWCAVGFISC
jgi:hypothetical protein